MFRMLLNGCEVLKQLCDCAFRDWNADNLEGCCERLEEFARDAETLACQAREAIAVFRQHTENTK